MVLGLEKSHSATKIESQSESEIGQRAQRKHRANWRVRSVRQCDGNKEEIGE